MRQLSVKGFAPAEWGISMTVFVILAAITIPNIGGWIDSAKVRANAEAFQNGIRFAQSEAGSRLAMLSLTNAINPPVAGIGEGNSSAASEDRVAGLPPHVSGHVPVKHTAFRAEPGNEI